MRKKLSAFVRKTFAEGLRRIDADFQRLDPVSGHALAFRKINAGLAEFVILELNTDWDAFNVSLAWNARNSELPPWMALTPEDAPINDSLRFPLYRFWDKRPARDPWYWEIVPSPALDDPAAWIAPLPDEEHSKERAAVLVEEALDKFQRFAATYFKGIEEGRAAASR